LDPGQREAPTSPPEQPNDDVAKGPGSRNPLARLFGGQRR